MFHQNIRLPGVYVFTYIANSYGMQGAPIFCTMSNLSILGMNDSCEKTLVFPKFKVIFYSDINFVTNATTVDNTNGTKCIYGTGLNSASSCKVYYDNVEISNVFSTSGN